MSLCLVVLLYWGPIAPSTPQTVAQRLCEPTHPDAPEWRTMVARCKAFIGAERCEVIVDPRTLTTSVEHKVRVR